MFSILDKTISGLKKTRNKISNSFASLSGKSFLDAEDIYASYKKALTRDDGKSTILVEYGDYHNEKWK